MIELAPVRSGDIDHASGPSHLPRQLLALSSGPPRDGRGLIRSVALIQLAPEQLEDRAHFDFAGKSLRFVFALERRHYSVERKARARGLRDSPGYLVIRL